MITVPGLPGTFPTDLILDNQNVVFAAIYFPSLYPVFLRKTPMRHETGTLAFRYLIYFPSDIIVL